MEELSKSWFDQQMEDLEEDYRRQKTMDVLTSVLYLCNAALGIMAMYIIILRL